MTDIPPITLEIVAKMIDEIALKLREENLYPKDILSVVSSIKPSEQFICFVNKVFPSFAESIIKMYCQLHFMETW